MSQLCYNSRDELVVVDLDKVAYIQAGGNYSVVVYITGRKTTITAGLSKIEIMIAKSYERGKPSPFVRLGRSVIINESFLRRVNVLKQSVMLSDLEHQPLVLSIPKSLIRGFKDYIEGRYKKQTVVE